MNYVVMMFGDARQTLPTQPGAQARPWRFAVVEAESAEEAAEIVTAEHALGGTNINSVSILVSALSTIHTYKFVGMRAKVVAVDPVLDAVQTEVESDEVPCAHGFLPSRCPNRGCPNCKP